MSPHNIRTGDYRTSTAHGVSIRLSETSNATYIPQSSNQVTFIDFFQFN